MQWQLKTPLDAIIFDCDSTLSRIEGIDELAALNGASAKVRQLTETAMGSTGINPAIYLERLRLTCPRAGQMTLLGEQYIHHLSPDARGVITVYQQMQKPIYIVSAGLLPAIIPLARHLQVPDNHVHAVDVRFDEAGQFVDFDRSNPLTDNQGKCEIIRDIARRHPRVGFVGDGLNDVAAESMVTRFVGYGGVVYRENIAALCDYYIGVPSFAPLLPLTLTADEQKALNGQGASLLQKGLQFIDSNGVKIQEVP